MKDRIRQILREETSNKILDAVLDANNNHPKVVKVRKRLIDDEGYLDYSMVERMGLFGGEFSDFQEKYTNTLVKYTGGGGNITYYKGSDIHRIGNPAYIDDTLHEWYVNGKIHRLDGPSEYYVNGDGSVDYQMDVYWWVDNDLIAKYTMEDGVDVSDQEVWDKYFKDDYERGY